MLSKYIQAVKNADFYLRKGKVLEISGLVIYASGPDVVIGELCTILPRRRPEAEQTSRILAEVIGVKQGRVALMPYSALTDVAVGCEVVALELAAEIAVGNSLLGRVIDGFGDPIDNLGGLGVTQTRKLKARPINPLQRPRISKVMETGVKAIDSLLTLGRGQRVGIFAGSGVGKSTLLGMVTRHISADLNVIALIGERGREVKEFIEKNLGEDGLKRTVVVVATSDQPALTRIRAAYSAIAIAEHFRDQGKHVLLTMDSVTRFAMAKREVGLAAGEPPTARGYTPSVFAELPELCERCGTSPSGGSITALMTVLVEGDDLNEPISDSLRSILDGHIVLSRHIAHRGQYPAIDILKSASRLLPDITSKEDMNIVGKSIQLLALLEKNRQMVDMGAYEHGSNPKLDQALSVQERLSDFLTQNDFAGTRAESMDQLRNILKAVS